jgi:CheY-like chemotaxis protein
MIQHIIFAEDDEDDQLYFNEVFHEISKDIHILFVPDGIQLIRLLESFLPDLIFLDLEMPYKNGLQCLVELRNNPSLSKLPIVVFSSTMNPSSIQTAYEMGAHLFLHKSSRYSEYSDCLKKIMSMDWDHPETIRDEYCTDNSFHSFNGHCFH